HWRGRHPRPAALGLGGRRGPRPVSTTGLTPTWMSHHSPAQYERGAVVRQRHVWRRCIVTYPIAFVVAGLSIAGWALPSPWSQLALLVLPLPALVEFVGEHRRRG